MQLSTFVKPRCLLLFPPRYNLSNTWDYIRLPGAEHNCYSKAFQKKQDDIRMKEQKVLQEKEKLTSEIVVIGLWQTQDDVVQQLPRLKSETKKGGTSPAAFML